MNEKQKYLIDLVEDAVSDLLYYDRKEDEDLSVKDCQEILTQEVVDAMVEKFRQELSKNIV